MAIREVSPICSFISDERGVTEPYTDLPAIAIAAIGLILFGFLVLSAYTSYASSAYYTAVREDMRQMTTAIESDPSIDSEGTMGVLSAEKLDAAGPALLSRYGRPGAKILMAIDASGYHRELGNRSSGVSASYRVPVTIVLNDAQSLPGSLTITQWER